MASEKNAESLKISDAFGIQFGLLVGGRLVADGSSDQGRTDGGRTTERETNARNGNVDSSFQTHGKWDSFSAVNPVADLLAKRESSRFNPDTNVIVERTLDLRGERPGMLTIDPSVYSTQNRLRSTISQFTLSNRYR
ncbi:hypothetical protein [Novipirellula galeiformis]|uniref:hypothetical protein n=1 Tax=Novipirellula galeiformis TaxID=2528004 RepID=UPI0018CC9967|nr:hypothetical protein [Novipirellula galeiformis]